MQNATLEKVIPQPIPVQIGSETVQVRPIKFGQLPVVVRASEPIMAQLQAGDYIAAALAHPEAFVDTLAAVSGLPREKVDALEMDEALTLVGACVEANIDFFFRAVAPQLEALANRVIRAIDTTGSTPASN